jgi:ribosomal peptide maturation radical SAM protein 1
VLQACARAAGFRVSVLYANLWLAAVLGEANYTEIGTPTVYPPQALVGERLFARSAHGMPPLGHWPDRMLDPERVFGTSETFRKGYARVCEVQTLSLTLPELRQLEERTATWVDEVAATVASSPYQVIGSSTSFAQTNASIALLQRVKRLRPEVTTVLGGKNCEGEMALGVASLDPGRQCLDYIFSGESDTTFVRFLQHHRSGRAPSRRVIYGEPCLDMDALPTPDFSEYFQQLAHFLPDLEARGDDVALVYETSRGCWWGQKRHCTFCGVNASSITFRQKSPQRVMADLRAFAETYPRQKIYMADSAMPYGYLRTLLPKLGQATLPVSLAYAQKANLCLSDVLALEKADVFLIEPGIESLSSNLLARMNKGLRAWQNIMLLRYARAVGLSLTWTILWGIPGDERGDYEQTLNLLPLMHHLPPPGPPLHLIIDRFSPYFDHPEAYGVRNITPFGSYAAVYPPGADLEKLAYHFVADYECASHQHPDAMQRLSQEITVWQKRWSSDGASAPVLHVIRSGDRYLLFDTRGLPHSQPIQILNSEQASVTLTARLDAHTPQTAWALEKKLGVVVDDRYVPLATADPALLQAFEGDARHKHKTT